MCVPNNSLPNLPFTSIYIFLVSPINPPSSFPCLGPCDFHDNGIVARTAELANNVQIKGTIHQRATSLINIAVYQKQDVTKLQPVGKDSTCGRKPM